MSMSCRSPSASAKTDLETVVNWPLLVTVAGLSFLLLAVPLVLACVAGMKGDAAKDTVAARPIPAAAEPVNVAPVAVPMRRIASYVPPKEAVTPLPVYAEGQPRNKPAAIVAPTPVAAKPTPAPEPIPQGPRVEGPTPPSVKRFDLSEEVLLRSLPKHANEVDLESVKGTREKLLAEAGKDKTVFSPILALCRQCADLKGLPLIGEADCQAGAKTARKREAISRGLQKFIQPRSLSFAHDGYYNVMHLAPSLAERKEWFQDDALSTMVQMIQAEQPDVRRGLVELIEKVNGVKASKLLARQALFDVTWEVREKAIDALKGRPREEYREVLLGGFRYPWPPVAAHAAEALVALDDRETLYPLVDLLDEPDPCAPLRDRSGKWMVRELVRVNHLRNCLLCHAPSTARGDPLRGVVPVPGKPLPRLYYEDRRGDFVRADVTYLRQDFSMIEEVSKPDRWPRWQRFDYMVRTRELTAEEQAAQEKKSRKSGPASYPQRDAVLFALRELTGLDAGDESADWYELLWAIEADVRH